MPETSKKIEEKKPWWKRDLADFLFPVRDVFFLAGLACVVRGVSLFSVPAAWIAAGAGLLLIGWALSK